MSFVDIPNEILEHILSFTGEYSGIVSRVCSLWNDTSNNRKLDLKNFNTVNLVIWGMENLDVFPMREIFNLAMYSANIEILNYGYEHIYDFLSACNFWTYICLAAVVANQLEVLKWARSRPKRPMYWVATISQAIVQGKIQILEWIISIGDLKDGSMDWCEIAAASGRLESLKSLKKYNFPWDSHAADAAVINGHLEVLDWMCSEDRNQDTEGGPCPLPNKLRWSQVTMIDQQIINWMSERMH